MNWGIIDFKFKKEIQSLPIQCMKKYAVFKYVVGTSGLCGLDKYPGYKLESLKGRLKGIYSVRLNIAYRLLFRVDKGKRIIEIQEISKHEYNQ